MTAKKVWYKDIEWKNVAKVVGYILASLGLGLGASTSGVIDGKASDVEGKLIIHEVTDSLRNVYIEQRLSKMEKDMQTIMQLNQETHEVVIRLEAKMDATRGQP